MTMLFLQWPFDRRDVTLLPVCSSPNDIDDNDIDGVQRYADACGNNVFWQLKSGSYGISAILMVTTYNRRKYINYDIA